MIWLFGTTAVACIALFGTTGLKKEKVEGLRLKAINQHNVVNVHTPEFKHTMNKHNEFIYSFFT